MMKLTTRIRRLHGNGTEKSRSMPLSDERLLSLNQVETTLLLLLLLFVLILL
ncbi:hypothetical protein LCGC14_3084090, partial [marine sediment metagenome]